MNKVVPVIVLIAIGWFSLYAYDRVENSKNNQLKKEIKQYEEEIDSIKKTLSNRNKELNFKIRKLTEGTEYRYQTLLIIFPDKKDQERIHNLFAKDEESTETNETDETQTILESEKE